MPSPRGALPKRPCVHPGCRELVTPGIARGRCKAHELLDYRQQRADRGPRVYDKARWRTLRLQVLAEEPICRCVDPACTTHPGQAVCHRPSQEPDHIVPLAQGGASLDRANLRGLCRRCNRWKSRFVDRPGTGKKE